MLQKSRKKSYAFKASFELQQFHPLGLNIPHALSESSQEISNSFLQIYLVLKKTTLDILKKNRQSQQPNSTENAEANYLSASDMGLVESHLMSEISNQSKKLEQNLFILATTVSLAPFLGLLGTIWGILITFSELQSYGVNNTNDMVLGGLSLALAATIIGLLVAIPALVAYNYLKSSTKAFSSEMEHFATVMLAAVEMQYRKVDIN